MKVAVCAVSGKLGAAISKSVVELLSKENVIGLARTPEKVRHTDIEIRPGDYNNEESLYASLTGVDVVLLVSGMDAPDQRIRQHRNVINAAKKNGVSKIVYTSIQGPEKNTAFSPVVQSNRQTEQDIQNSGLDWVIGRNGIYIEPDIEYIDAYKKSGEIRNCAGNAKCAYTIRTELAYAYARMLTEDKHNGHIYNLHGESITQNRLVEYLNYAFGVDLNYTAVSVDEFQRDRTAELGDFLGTIIAGIYQGINQGDFDNPSHFSQAAGREHTGWQEYFTSIKAQLQTG